MTAYITCTTGPQKGQIFPLEKQENWILGSDPHLADLTIEDAEALGKHLKISQKGDDFFLTKCAEEANSLYNGAFFSDEVLLKEGDVFTIGSAAYSFSKSSLPSTPNRSAFDTIFEDEEQAQEMPKIAPDLPEDPESPIDTFVPFASAEEDEEKTAYDTIFEEGEGHDPLPFNLLHDASLILKVIAGPNAGAEIALEKGRTYILGKDPTSADIVFQDLSVSRRHAQIVITHEGVITLRDLDSKNKTYVNHRDIDQEVTISSQDIIATGTTTFLIIDREADLQTIYAPEAREQITFPEQVETSTEEEAAHWKKETIPVRYFLFAGSFALVIVVMLFSLFSVFQGEETSLSSPSSKQQTIAELFSGYHDLTFNYSPHSGKIFLVGHVLTPMRKETLLHELENLPFIEGIEENVIVDEYVVASFNQVLVENMDLKGVSLYAPKAGLFVATGYLDSAQQLARLSDYLYSTFPYADRLENHVVVEANLREEVQNLLVAQGFAGLKIRITNGMLTLAGLYDKKELAKYEDLLRTLRKLRGIRGLKNQAVASSVQAARIDLTQNYQVSGFARYTTPSKEYAQANYILINGKILRTGELFNGMRITRILPDRVLLERNGLQYKIDYAR